MKALKIAKQNRAIAKARWDAKKKKTKHGIPQGAPLPPLVEHPNFYCLGRSMRVDVSPWQVGCSSTAGFCPWNGTASASPGVGYHCVSPGRRWM